MPSTSSSVERVCETLDAYFALGNEWSETPGACFVTCPEAPIIHDANHGCRVTAEDPRAVEAVLAETERRFAGLGHRLFRCDPRTPPAFEARLVVEDYALELDLQLLLEGELRASPREVEIREVRTEADWEEVYRLTRLDHTEEAGKEQRGNYRDDVTREMVGRRRAKGPALTSWLAREDGVDCAFLSSWPGVNGLGKVEDLFTQPEFRRRGIATALIAHGVADCRRRGAAAVEIAARPDDTPKHLYVALGFQPCCATRTWLKKFPSSEAS